MTASRDNSGTLFPVLSTAVLIAVVGGGLWLASRALAQQLPPNLAELAMTYSCGAIVLLGSASLVAWFASIGGQRGYRLPAHSGVILWTLAAASYVSFAFVGSVLKYRAMHMYADFGNNLEILWREIHELGLTSPMFEPYHGDLHWFSAHFSPLAYLIAWGWFRWLPRPEVLPLLETLALASGAIPVLLFAFRHLPRNAAYLVGATYFLYPTLQFLGVNDFGLLQFSVPFMATAFYALHVQRYWLYWPALALALICREEVGLVVAGMGVYSAWRGDRLLGTVTALLGFAYTAVVLSVVIPSFRGPAGYLYMKHYEAFGGGVWGLVFSLIRHPVEMFNYLGQPTRLANAAMFLMPTGFVSLLAPEILAIGALNIGAVFLADAVSVYSYLFYYLCPSLPLVFFATIKGISRRMPAYGAAPLTGFVVASAVGATVLFGPTPAAIAFWKEDYQLGQFHTLRFHWTAYVESEDVKAAKLLVALVPQDAVVSTEQQFTPYLYDRRRVYVFPFREPDVEYVLFDRRFPFKTGFLDTYLDFRSRPEFYYSAIANDPAWLLVARSGGAELYQRTPTER